MFALNLLATAPVTYLTAPTAHVHTTWTLRAARFTALGTTALLSWVGTMTLGTVYVALTAMLALTLQAHEHAGYTPLLAGPTPQPVLALPSWEMRAKGAVHGPALSAPCAPQQGTSTLDQDGETTHRAMVCAVAAPVATYTLTEFEQSHPTRFDGAGHQALASTHLTSQLADVNVLVLKRVAKSRGVERYYSLRKAQLVAKLDSLGVTFSDCYT